MNCQIDRACTDDAAQILRLQRAAYQAEAELYGDYQIPPLTQTLANLQSDVASHTFYVARDDNKLIASVNIRIEGSVGKIGRLIVAPELQGYGLGRTMMDHVEGAHSNVAHFELFTGHKSERNLRFYQARGYSIHKQEFIHDGLTLVYVNKPNPVF